VSPAQISLPEAGAAADEDGLVIVIADPFSAFAARMI
jgi:hypothetical protein